VWACGRVGDLRREAPTRGEPLWIVPKKPAIFVFARGRPEISLNRRLPRTFQRVLGYRHLKRIKNLGTVRWAKHRVR
jgi:hypothetical protein